MPRATWAILDFMSAKIISSYVIIHILFTAGVLVGMVVAKSRLVHYGSRNKSAKFPYFFEILLGLSSTYFATKTHKQAHIP